MHIALFQPDIPGNTGTILRLAACFSVPVEIIEPCGFVWSDAKLRRAGMDYMELANVTRHMNWAAFCDAVSGRLVLATTKAEQTAFDFAFQPDDILLFGQESAGVPKEIHDAVPNAVKIPMATGARSLNVAMSAGIILAEASRQTGGLPTQA
ncbi:MAG: tRNA (cytidine(34)-2'-O)-methyltransferase [Alphaproteobacteria bacterium]